MATFSGGVRSGLPRVPGGDPWPPAGTVAEVVASAPVAETSAGSAQVTPAERPDVPSGAQAAPAPAGPATTSAIRSGLPRIPGGDPWPPAGTIAAVAPAAAAAAAPVPERAEVPVSSTTTAPVRSATETAAVTPAATVVPTGEVVTEEVSVRQGLPRTPGGEAWPTAKTATVTRTVTETPAPSGTSAGSATDAPSAAQHGVGKVDEAAVAPATPAQAAGSAQIAATEATVAAAKEAPATAAAAAGAATVAASAATVKVAAEAKAAKAAKQKAPARQFRGKTVAQWGKLAGLWGGGAIVAAGIAVLAARGVTTLPGVPEFMAKYPGEYALPEFVEDGFAGWARWQHFFNFFLMALIVRSGLLVRQQTKPDAFYTPKKGGKKVSIYLWLHTSLDIFWVVNGVIFVVLLFTTGHWARIVPTSWEVIPNALSAGLQYATLEWPHEDGWHNFNSLQQIMYFTVVFIAAPLAIITGVRMSEWWPKDAEKLNRLYPAPVARKIHFPVMLFFVFFTIVHVFLVFATGFRKNLNHMFLGTPVESWGGFLWFAAAILVTAAGVWAARPLVLAPVAGAFGKVSER